MRCRNWPTDRYTDREEGTHLVEQTRKEMNKLGVKYLLGQWCKLE